MPGGSGNPDLPPPFLAPFLPGEDTPARAMRLRAEAIARRRRALTRPRQPRFCWVAVQLHGEEVDRPGVVVKWESRPDHWWAQVAWTDSEENLHVTWVTEDALTAVTPERAP